MSNLTLPGESRRSLRLNVAAYLSGERGTRDRALFAIIALGFALGCYGIWWGWVECWNPDQMALLRLLGTGRGFLEPADQLKPPFHTYFDFFLAVLPLKVLEKLTKLVTGTNVDFGVAILIWSRFIQLFLFLGVVYVSYRIVHRAAGHHAGRLIALFTATSAGFLLQAHFLTADIPVTFWMLVSFWAAQSIIDSGRMRDYMLAGLLTGVATATKYNGLAVGLAIPLFHWFANTRRPFLRTAFDRRLVIGVAMVAVGFILADPYAVLSYKKFAADFYYDYATTPVWDGQNPGDNSFLLFPLRVTEILGLPLTIITLAGVIGALVYMRRWEHLQRATLGAALGVFLLYLYQFGSMPRLEVRFVLPVVPFLLIVAAPAWVQFLRWRRVAAVAAIAAVVAYNVIASGWVGHRFASDPRMTAQAWVASNVPAGSTIESSYYSPGWNKYPGIDVNDIRMPMMSGRRMLFLQMFASNAKILDMVQERESDAWLNWPDIHALSSRQPDDIALDSLDFERFFESPKAELYPQVARYLRQLLAGELGYQIVFDQTAIAAPKWLYPAQIGFVDNRMVILKRVR